MQPQQAFFESLFKRSFSDPGNKELLEEITTGHPYFSPAQFYLLQQAAENTEAFDKQALKTNLLFNNPFWLNFQLQQMKQAARHPNESLLKQEIPPVPGVLTEEPVNIPEEIPVEASPVPSEIKSEPDPVKEEIQVTESFTEPQIKEPPIKIELKLPDEKEVKDDALLFEPMHLVDYFASQGIKLGEEIQTGDKLGRQLKSFTEWLKTMKKVHTTGALDETVQTDTSVEAMAELSNRENEVITEAMAEVFARQGKKAKAIEVYQKLSLLNPAKSAYFAAKIDHLKEA